MDEQTTPASDNAASVMLNRLLTNPELLKSIGSILSSSGENAKPTAPTADSGDTDGLSKALADPALMAKLPQVMAMLQPMLASTPAEPTKQADSSSSNDNAVPTIGSPIPKHPVSDCRNDLLLALKPFLSPGRCEAVDTIIRLSRLGSVLKHLQ